MSNEMDESAVVELTGKIMVVAVIVLFVVVIFVFFLHLYAKWFWYRTDHNLRRRRRLDIGAGHEEVRAVQHGLDPSVLKSIPAVIFSAQDGIECAVCLSEVSDGEKGRLLPKCKHGFHVECIDMWFQSHSTCPICRNPLSNLLPADSSSVEEARIEIPAEEEEEVPVLSTPFPTNVLFWGNESQVSTFVAPELPSTSASTSRRDGEMVIEIPKQMNYKRDEDEEEEEEDSKSPSRLSTPTPTPTRMTSFKRLFISSSRDTRVNPTTTTPHVQQVAPN